MLEVPSGLIDAGADAGARNGYCGDGIVRTSKPATAEAATTTGRRRAAPTARCRCGDGVTDEGETCDDGNSIGADGCAPGCREEGDLEIEPNITAVRRSRWGVGADSRTTDRR